MVSNTKAGDIVVVFGAGESYKLTRKIFKQMNPVLSGVKSAANV